MIAYLTHRNIAFVLACLIGVGAFTGSAAELVRIAEHANYALPVGLVAALDGLSIVCVVVLARRPDWQAAITLALATLASVGLQVLAVPRTEVVAGATAATAVPVDRYVSAVLVHVLVPLASFMAIHLATRLDRAGASSTGRQSPRRPRPPKPAPAPVEVPPTPLRPPRPDSKPVRPAARTLEQLVAQAVDLARERGVEATDLSQRTLMNELGIGSGKAAGLWRALKDRPTATGVAVPEPALVSSSNGSGPS